MWKFHICILYIAGFCGNYMKSTSHAQIAKPPLKIAAFNIQIFGNRKISKKNVATALIKILSRYDIIAVQEIRDRSGTATVELLQKLNDANPLEPFILKKSDPLGRTDSKEQYGVLYRKDKVTATDEYLYTDPGDKFEREPYTVRFSSPNTELDNFAVMVVHTSPKSAVSELDYLTMAYDAAVRDLGTDNILIAGDFNADCTYVSRNQLHNKRLWTDPRFTWLISSCEDTTVKASVCAYDRFVVAGSKMLDAIVPGSAQVYNFTKDLRLTQEQAEQVSDHFPIEIQIQGKRDRMLQSQIRTYESFKIKMIKPSQESAVRSIYRGKKSLLISHGYDITVFKVDTAMNRVVAVNDDVRDIIKTVGDFMNVVPDVFSENEVAMLHSYVSAQVLDKPKNVYGLIEHVQQKYIVEIDCSLNQPYLCSLSVSKKVS